MPRPQPSKRKSIKNARLKCWVVHHRWDSRIVQKKMAEDLGIPRSMLSYIENCHHEPSLYLALRIAKYLNTTVEKLFEIKK